MRITIVGGGNIGTALCAELAHKGHRVSLLTSKPKLFRSELSVMLADEDQIVSGKMDRISDLPQDVLPSAEMIIVTLPAFLMRSFADRALPYVQPGTILVTMPGYGGVEFIFKDIVEKGVILVGFQRVPAVYRLIEYGRCSRMSGRRAALHFAALPADKTTDVKDSLEAVFSMPCMALQNFLCVTLTPSNPILHTARLYSLFGDLPADGTLDQNPLFYGEWSPAASHWLIRCDAELQALLTRIPLNLHEVVSLKQHYESDTEEAMTNKLRSIQSLHTIRSPMVEDNGCWRIDWNSRYFQADFPFGLAIIRGIAELFAAPTPAIDVVLSWYAQSVGLEYYLSDGSFAGKDLNKTGIPQNYGIRCANEFIQIYTGDREYAKNN